MNRLNLCFMGADGTWVPVSADNPLPIGTAGAPTAAEAARTAVPAARPVDDVPAKATVAQVATTVNELLAALRDTGLLQS
jgi:hypothetical protein